MATRSTRASIDQQTADEAWAAVPAGAQPSAQAALDDLSVEQSPIERVMVALQDTVEPGKRVRLQLYRLVSGGPGKPDREEWCADLTPDEFELGGLGSIRDTWGPGSYVAHLMGYKRGSNYFTRVASPRFSLAPIPGNAQQRTQDFPAMAGLESALRALADGQTRMIEAMIEQRSAPAPNPMEQLQQTLGLMTTMREAMGINNQPRPEKSSIAEIMEAIRELKEVSSLVNPPDAAEKSDLERLVELATPLVGMAQQAMLAQPARQSFQAPQLQMPTQFQGASNVVSHQAQSFGQVRTAGVSNFEGVETTNPTQRNLSPEMDEPHSARADAQAPATGENGVDVENQESVLNELQSHLANLVTMAEKNESVEAGAELVYDKLPDDWIELLHLPIWWQALLSAAPQVAPHATWFDQVRARVVQMFEEDEQELQKLDADSQGA